MYAFIHQIFVVRMCVATRFVVPFDVDHRLLALHISFCHLVCHICHISFGCCCLLLLLFHIYVHLLCMSHNGIALKWRTVLYCCAILRFTYRTYTWIIKCVIFVLSLYCETEPFVYIQPHNEWASQPATHLFCWTADTSTLVCVSCNFSEIFRNLLCIVHQCAKKRKKNFSDIKCNQR